MTRQLTSILISIKKIVKKKFWSKFTKKLSWLPIKMCSSNTKTLPWLYASDFEAWAYLSLLLRFTRKLGTLKSASSAIYRLVSLTRQKRRSMSYKMKSLRSNWWSFCKRNWAYFWCKVKITNKDCKMMTLLMGWMSLSKMINGKRPWKTQWRFLRNFLKKFWSNFWKNKNKNLITNLPWIWLRNLAWQITMIYWWDLLSLQRTLLFFQTESAWFWPRRFY